MHENNYLHNELLTSNILYNSDTQTIKICNFSKSIKIFDYVDANVISPEPANKISKKTDTWHLGIILINMCTLGDTLKFRTSTSWDELKYNVENFEFNHDKFNSVTGGYYSEFTVMLLDLLLIKDYKLRPEISQVLPIIKKYKNYLDGIDNLSFS